MAAPVEPQQAFAAVVLAAVTACYTIANLNGGLADATPTCQIIPATIPGHQPNCRYNHDLARAREVIAASGTRGDTVTVLAEASIGPAFEPVGAYMVGLLRQLGYHGRLHVVTAAQWNAAINDYRHPAQIATESWTADYPSAAQCARFLLGSRSTGVEEGMYVVSVEPRLTAAPTRTNV